MQVAYMRLDPKLTNITLQYKCNTMWGR